MPRWRPTARRVLQCHAHRRKGYQKRPPLHRRRFQQPAVYGIPARIEFFSQDNGYEIQSTKSDQIDICSGYDPPGNSDNGALNFLALPLNALSALTFLPAPSRTRQTPIPNCTPKIWFHKTTKPITPSTHSTYKRQAKTGKDIPSQTMPVDDKKIVKISAISVTIIKFWPLVI